MRVLFYSLIRRNIKFLLVFLLSGVIVACGGHTSSDQPSTSDNNGTTVAVENAELSHSVDYNNPNFSVADFPDGDFKGAANGLSPEAQANLLQRLKDMRVPPSQYGGLHVTADGSFIFDDSGFFDGLDTELPDTVGGLVNESVVGNGLVGANPAEGANTGNASQATADEEPLPNYAETDVFSLHSKPGANRVIYLDFNGEVIEQTRYNTYVTLWFQPSLRYDAKPFSLDSDYSQFSQEELRDIVNIWHQIAEDFAAFNVNVTTELPASFNRHTGRILFTESADEEGRDMPRTGPFIPAGVAWPNVFGEDDYHTFESPALVYVDRIIQSSSSRRSFATVTARVASHEMGHNLGLSHDGDVNSSQSGGGYYAGHGIGKISWSPIMGNGSKEVIQWSIGEYAVANNFEDDLAIMADKLNLRPDDVPDDVNATDLPRLATAGDAIIVHRPVDGITAMDQANRANQGIIGLNASGDPDVDVFEFDMAAGKLQLTITPQWHGFQNDAVDYLRGSNLDVYAELYDADGTLVQVASESNDTFAKFDQNFPEGRYYLAISAESSVNYSAYSSQGGYFIHGKRPEPQADLSVDINLAADDREANSDNQQTYTLQYLLRNDGPNFAGNVSVLVSPDGSVTMVQASADGMSSYDHDNGKWLVEQLCSGCESVLTIEYATPNILASADFAAEVIYSTSNDPDSEPNNQALSEDDYIQYTVPPIVNADVSLSAVVIEDTRLTNGQYQIRYTLSNAGDNAAQQLETRVVDDSSVTIQAVTSSSGSFANGVWSVADLNVAESIDLVVAYHEAEASSYSLSHSSEVIGSAVYDPDSSPNNGVAAGEDDAVEITLVSTLPQMVDIEISRQTEVQENAGQTTVQAQYTLYNAGEFPAEYVVVQMSESGEVYRSPATVTSGLFTEHNKQWRVTNLQPGQAVKLSFVATLPPALPNQHNRATVRMEVIEIDKPDVDSMPNNHNESEDDMVTDGWYNHGGQIHIELRDLPEVTIPSIP